MVDSNGTTGFRKGCVEAQAEFRLVLAKTSKRLGSDQPESIMVIIMQKTMWHFGTMHVTLRMTIMLS